MKVELKRAITWIMLVVMVFTAALSCAALADTVSTGDVSLSTAGISTYETVFQAADATATVVGKDYFEFIVGDKEQDAPDGFTGVASGEISASKLPEIESYAFEYAYVDAETNKITDVALYNGNVYYRTEGGNVAGVVLKNGEKISLVYSVPFTQYDVEYVINVTDAKVAAAGTFTASPKAPLAKDKDFEFSYTMPKSVASATFKVEVQNADGSYTELTGITLKQNGSTYTGTIPYAKITGNLRITATETPKTNYTLTLTGSNAAYKTTGNWAELWQERQNSPVSMEMSCAEASFQLHGRYQWSTEDKALNKIAITLTAEDGTKSVVNLLLPMSGLKTDEQNVNGMTFVVECTEGDSSIEEKYNRAEPTDREISWRDDKYKKCSTRTYTVTIKNCYENISIDVNFQDITEKEIWLLKLDGVDPIYSEEAITGDGWPNADKHLWNAGGTNYINDKNFGGEMTFYVRAQDGYEFADGDGVTLKAYNGTTETTITAVKLEKLSTPVTKDVTYTHSFTIDTKNWHGYKNSRTSYYRWTIELKASKKVYSYQVKYDLNGGSGSFDTINVTESAFTVSDAIPTLEGKVFAGWKAELSDGTEVILMPGEASTVEKYAAVETTENNVNLKVVTLTAKWAEETESVAIPYTIKVTLYDYAGNVEKDSPYTLIETAYLNNQLLVFDERLETRLQQEMQDTSFKLTDYPVRKGEPTGTVKENTVIELCYYRQATINYVAVPENGGTVSSSTETLKPIKKDTTAAGSTATAAAGFRFDGWYTDAACTTKVPDSWVDASGKIKPEMPAGGWPQTTTYYAKFVQDTTTVTVTKKIEGNFGDKSKTFTFEYKRANDASWTTVNNIGNNGTFVIGEVSLGSTLLIREKTEGYVGSVGSSGCTAVGATDGEYYTATVTIPQTITEGTSLTVTFTNTNEVDVDTGISLDSLPYILILAVVVLGAAAVVIRKRKNRDDY